MAISGPLGLDLRSAAGTGDRWEATRVGRSDRPIAVDAHVFQSREKVIDAHRRNGSFAAAFG